jgi:hypothetical protein
MEGNVFQFPEEDRKGNQFNLTMEALQSYIAIELDHVKDLDSLFLTPSIAAILAEPSKLPPLSSNGKSVLSANLAHTLHGNTIVTFSMSATTPSQLIYVILLQCSTSVKTKLEATPGYVAAKLKHECSWLITNLKNICHKLEHSCSLQRKGGNHQ